MKLKQFIEKEILNSIGKINSRKLNKKWFEKNSFHTEWEEINTIESPFDLSEKIKLILTDYKRNYCRVCGKEIKQEKQFCSLQCAGKSENRLGKWTSESTKKRKITMQERFGVDSTFHRVEVQQKVKDSVKEKYNVENVSQLLDVKLKKLQSYSSDKRRMNFESKVKNRFDCDDVHTVINHNAFENISDSFITKMINKELTLDCEEMQKFSLSYRYCIIRRMNDGIGLNSTNISSLHRKYINFLTEYEVDFIINDRKQLCGKEIDIFIPASRVGIEINGSYWHSDQKVGEKYHIEKTDLAASKGIRLIHIFDFDNFEKMKARILSILNIDQIKLFARKCKVISLNKETTDNFLNEFHIQGTCQSSFSYGLLYQEEIVSVMTFGKPRFSNDAEFELLRFASRYSVIGGASKLLSRFIKDQSPKTIMTFSDLRFGYTDFYEKLGFISCNITRPNYKWINTSTGQIFSRYQTQRAKLEILFSQNFDKQLSESDIMRSRKFIKIYDCGNQKLIMEI